MPHFEKMLYDNALLVPAYLHGWLVTGNERYREIVEETVTYLLRELALPERRLRVGAGRGHGRRRGADLHVDVESEGVPAEFLQPFEHGRSILRGELPPELKARAVRAARAAAEAAAATTRRSRPGTGWRSPRWPKPAGGSSATTGSTRRGGSASSCSGRCRRRRAGSTARTATASRRTRASSTTTPTSRNGLYELHVATGELRWLEESRRLALLAVELFGDEERGGFFLTPKDGEALVARKKSFDDHPTPSGNSMLAYVLLRLARIYGDAELERRAVGRLPAARRRPAPRAVGRSAGRSARSTSTSRRRASSRSSARRTTTVARAALAPWEPNTVVAFGPAEGVALLEGKVAVDGKPTVYVCENFACRAPVTDAAQLASRAS